jgi:hypothetical protein
MTPKGNFELYTKAVELHEKVYRRASWDKEKYQIKIGHMLQGLFGKYVWTLKDLSDEQLWKVIEIASLKFNKRKNWEKREVHNSPALNKPTGV